MTSSLSPRIRQLLQYDPVCIVDVGARGGLQTEWRDIGKYCTFVGFEAESVEAARLKRTAAPNELYVQAALYGEPTTATLYHCLCPARSSLYHPNYEVISEVYGSTGTYQVERVENIDVTTLDLLLDQGALPRPNFLKLDTQGCELDVLRGARKALAGPLIAMEVEVEFLPLYRGQPLFPDIDSYLRASGFELVGFKNLYTKYDLRFGMRGTAGYANAAEFLQAWAGRLIPPRGKFSARSQLVYGDALYVRRSDGVLAQCEDGTVSVAKAVLLSAILKVYEYAFEALEKARARGLIADDDARTLERFVYARSRDLRPLWRGAREQSARLFRRLVDPGRRSA